MPTYDYVCTQCGHEFELVQKMTDAPKKRCPKCRGKIERKIGAGAGLIFKGSGFYITDYRSKDYQSKAKADGAAGGGSSGGTPGGTAGSGSSGGASGGSDGGSSSAAKPESSGSSSKSSESGSAPAKPPSRSADSGSKKK